MKRVLLGLGSNKSFNQMSPMEILKNACFELNSILANSIFSSVYKTKAMYVENQDDFYNMVAYGFVADDLNAFDLLEKIHTIENKYGRNREKEIRFGPRSLDIDIELFGDEVINHPDLQIPHIRIKERPFVLIPAIEILQKTTDVNIAQEYINFLENLKHDDVEKYMLSSELFSLNGGFYGTRSKN